MDLPNYTNIPCPVCEHEVRVVDGKIRSHFMNGTTAR